MGDLLSQRLSMVSQKVPLRLCPIWLASLAVHAALLPAQSLWRHLCSIKGTDAAFLPNLIMSLFRFSSELFR
jgi:hypothetical protein